MVEQRKLFIPVFLLIALALPAHADRFTSNMRVLTPDGYIEISRLRVGDLVYSWDTEEKELVLNRISIVHKRDMERYGDLTETPTGIPLQLTPMQELYLPDLGEYFDVMTIDPQVKILAIQPETCEQILIPRGHFLPKGMAEVRTLSLKRWPYNFIVEGIVVRQK